MRTNEIVKLLGLVALVAGAIAFFTRNPRVRRDAEAVSLGAREVSFFV